MTLSLEEYSNRDAVGLTELIKSNETNAAELEEVARAAITSVNNELNALAFPLFDDPLSSSPSGAFAGVPFLIKDWGPIAEGVPFTGGAKLFEGGVAPYDQEVMRRFREAGLVTLGATTTPEMSISFATESRLHGITRNPWDLSRGVGGSSGGTAALVGARAVPIAQANDAAGSIRLPAACCGVVGFKPSRGRTPNGPDTSDSLLGLGYEFALTRSIRDAALLLDVLQGPEPWAKFVLPRYEGSYAEVIKHEPGPLRIAYTSTPWNPTSVDPECAAAVEQVARQLEALGHHVEPASPAIAADAMRAAFRAIIVVYIADAISFSPVPPSHELLEAVSMAVYEEATRLTVPEIAAGLHGFDAVVYAVHSFFETFDVLITPTMARPAVPHGTYNYDSPGYTADSWFEASLEYGPFTPPFNISGEPAISLPLAQSSDGLPIGVQLVGRPNRDDQVLQVARQLEQTMPWLDRVPPHGVRAATI